MHAGAFEPGMFVMRWPGMIPAGQVLNGIFSLEDVLPTIMAAVSTTGLSDLMVRCSR